MQRPAVRFGKRPVVRDQKRGAMEQTVSRIGPAALQHHQREPLRLCVVGVLDQLPEQRAPIPCVLVDVGQQIPDRPDLVKRASDDAGVAPDIDTGQAFFVDAFIHESGASGFRGCRLMSSDVGEIVFAQTKNVSTGGLNAYNERELVPMRPFTGQAKLRRPTTAVALDALDPDPAAGWPPVPRTESRRTRVRHATLRVLLRWPLPAAQATIVSCPSPHDPRPRRRRASR